MRKALFALLILILVVCKPAPAYALTMYTATCATDDKYSAMFYVNNKFVIADGFIAGYKLSDHYVTGHVTYCGIPVSLIIWANPDYVVVEGKQEIQIIGQHEDKQVILTAEIEGVKEPKKKLFGGPLEKEYWCDVGSNYADVLKGVEFRFGTEIISGTLVCPDWDSSREGLYEFTWIFTPDDLDRYDIKTGTIKVRFFKPVTFENEIPDEPTPPSLTATTVTLSTLTEYDINLDNKVSGSTYSWSSSDTDIVEVNPKNGLIKAKKEGRAIITCEITLPDGAKQTLSSVVNVGYDENAPTLTETVLDLEVGDKFDINLENKIAKSKYRWVSSDRSVVKVNTSNGKITAVGPGQAYVTCTITTPDKQVIVLRCNITVTEPEITE